MLVLLVQLADHHACYDQKYISIREEDEGEVSSGTDMEAFLHRTLRVPIRQGRVLVFSTSILDEHYVLSMGKREHEEKKTRFVRIALGELVKGEVGRDDEVVLDQHKLVR